MPSPGSVSFVLVTIRPALPAESIAFRHLSKLVIQALALVQLQVSKCCISESQDLVLHPRVAHESGGDVQPTPV